jgi:hypothetical protein
LKFDQVLNGVGDDTSGGVILFVTDGVQDCHGPDKDTITNPALLQRVKDTKVRIITIAFGYVYFIFWVPRSIQFSKRT